MAQDDKWASPDHLCGSPLALSSFEISSPVRTLSIYNLVCARVHLERTRTVVETAKPKILHLVVDLLGTPYPDDPAEFAEWGKQADLQMIGWSVPILETEPVVPLEMLVVELQMTTAHDEHDFHYRACVGPRNIAQRSQPPVIVLYFHVIENPNHTRSSKATQSVERLLASVDPYKVAYTVASGEPFRSRQPEPETIRVFVKRKSNFLDDFQGWCMKRSRDTDGKIVEKDEVGQDELREMQTSLGLLGYV
ncbi:unnamed protein product [Peniophora sp. CBMAI 1063]|nr:unnamed protein product [Peniophora sp. CBMAI 1063]